jgi:hypothetical protein
MSSPATRTVYHVDDLVKVVKPDVIIRVGYPLTREIALDAVEKEYNDNIRNFMCSVGAAEADDQFFNSPEYDPRLYGDLLNAMASRYLRVKEYGGKERKIYTEADQRILATNWRVLSKRVVKTGTYNRGGYSGGYDGEPDYDPPYLENERTHVLLALEPTTLIEGPWRIEIEAANVQPVK